MLAAVWAPPAEAAKMVSGCYLERVVQGVRASWALFGEWHPELTPALQPLVEATMSNGIDALDAWVAGRSGNSGAPSRRQRPPHGRS